MFGGGKQRPRRVARHPCTVGKRRAKAAKPAKRSGGAGKKTAKAKARHAKAHAKAHAAAHKTASRTAKARAKGRKAAAGKQAKRAKVAAAKPC